MATSCLCAVDLDTASIARHGEALERERRVAMYDLIESGDFRPVRSATRGASGPYRLAMRSCDGRLELAITDAEGAPLETVILAMGGFKRTIRDYLGVCESYGDALGGGRARLETVDMARRGLHDDAARALIDRLDGKIAIDFATARRLFTLICVLHIRV